MYASPALRGGALLSGALRRPEASLRLGITTLAGRRTRSLGCHRRLVIRSVAATG